MVRNFITQKNITQVSPGFIILFLLLKRHSSVMGCYVLFILTFSTCCFLGWGEKCQPVALQRKTGGSHSTRPLFPSDSVPHSWKPRILGSSGCGSVIDRVREDVVKKACSAWAPRMALVLKGKGHVMRGQAGHTHGTMVSSNTL